MYKLFLVALLLSCLSGCSTFNETLPIADQSYPKVPVFTEVPKGTYTFQMVFYPTWDELEKICGKGAAACTYLPTNTMFFNSYNYQGYVLHEVEHGLRGKWHK
jgi:hypothetical protein